MWYVSSGVYCLSYLQGNRRRFSVRRHQNRKSSEVNQVWPLYAYQYSTDITACSGYVVHVVYYPLMHISESSHIGLATCNCVTFNHPPPPTHTHLHHTHPHHTQPPQDDASSGLVGGSSGSQENLLSPSNEAGVVSNLLAPTTPPTDLENREAFTSEQNTPSSRSFSTKLRRLARNRASPGAVRKPQFKGHLKPSQEEDNYVGNGSSVHEEGSNPVNYEPSETQENKPAKWNRKSM